MTETNTFLDALIRSVSDAASYNSLDQDAPAAIFWPDEARDWETLTPRLRQRIPILTFGPYERASLCGPAPWLRCMVARALPESPPRNSTPVIYLPGVSARDVRETERHMEALALLAELRYRSVLWIEHDDFDWTIAAFLRSKDGGLGVEVLTDHNTVSALRRVLPVLADVPVSRLREEAPWKARDFDGLVGLPVEPGPDLRTLIQQGESAQLEFKATARWDFQNDRKFAPLEHNIVKAVTAFLNSYHGGTLLIGVNDDGSIHGIEDDFKTWSKPEKRNVDQYETWLTGDLLLKTLGKEFAPYIKVSFRHLDGHAICKVDVAPAPQPAFAREKKEGKDEETFYIRTGNQTLSLTVREALEYSRNRWDW